MNLKLNQRKLFNLKNRVKYDYKTIEQSLRDVWSNIKMSNIYAIGVPERQEKDWCRKIFEEIVTKNFPNLMKIIISEMKNNSKSQIQKT